MLRPHDSKYLRRLNNYTNEEIRYRLENYVKFMFVRHPIERVISAYRSKFLNTDLARDTWFISQFGREIIKKYRPNATNESLTIGNDVIFKEFVQYLIDLPPMPREWLDEHWRPVVDLCHPCTIDYDVIGKYDTLKTDTWMISAMANLGGQINEFPSSCQHGKTKNLIEKYTNELTKEELFRLSPIYALDFKMFNYF